MCRIDHHRYYNPNLGNYIQSDPIGLDRGVHCYVYVLGDPVNFIDPNGLVAVLTGGECNTQGCRGDGVSDFGLTFYPLST